MPRRNPTRTTLTLKVGRWLEVQATGWAVAVTPLILLLVAGVIAAASHPGWKIR